MVGEGARRHFAALERSRFADVRWVTETASTNDDAMALARDGAPEGVVVVADHQTAGRGRKGRVWQAPPAASLLMTVLLRPPEVLAEVVTMAASLALAEGVEDATGVVPSLKWPNDLVVGERKLAGVLAEAAWPASPSEPDVVVVVGLGVNVTWPSPLPDEIRDTAVALNQLGVVADREAILVAFLRRLETRYGELVDRGDRASLMAAWRQRSATLDRRVRVDLGTREVEGTAVDVTDDGHLVVDTGRGNRETLAAGDVIHLRST